MARSKENGRSEEKHVGVFDSFRDNNPHQFQQEVPNFYEEPVPSFKEQSSSKNYQEVGPTSVRESAPVQVVQRDVNTAYLPRQ